MRMFCASIADTWGDNLVVSADFSGLVRLSGQGLDCSLRSEQVTALRKALKDISATMYGEFQVPGQVDLSVTSSSRRDKVVVRKFTSCFVFLPRDVKVLRTILKVAQEAAK